MNRLRMVRSTLNILPLEDLPSSMPHLLETPPAFPVCSSTVFMSWGAFFAEHNCHDHGAGGFGVVYVHAVQFCDCLGVECGAFEVAADCEGGQAHGGDGADAGHECGCTGDTADGGDVAQVGAVEALVDLFGGFVGMRFTEFLTIDSASGRCMRSTLSRVVVSAGRGLPSSSNRDFFGSSMLSVNHGLVNIS